MSLVTPDFAQDFLDWKGGRVVNCNGLENRDSKGPVGSNPSPSA